jgi:hypothetical protein
MLVEGIELSGQT